MSLLVGVALGARAAMKKPVKVAGIEKSDMRFLKKSLKSRCKF